MKRSLRDHDPVTSRRRGVTLVEMLVTLAVLLLMMTVIVQIFQAATGALNAAQVYQELDNQLRLLDSTLRSDLNGVTCKLTPPNDPKNNQGYLEYGENEFADVQGEDSDDYIRFTAKAPAGRPFTGRTWIGVGNQLPQPITINSEYAEVIYFLRNGNLYRRVLLVAPERQSTIVGTIDNLAGGTTAFSPLALGTNAVSWQGVNDLSAHPAPQGTVAQNNNNSVVLNTLANLTNRENRAFYQRFGNDFEDLQRNHNPDGLVDDFNQDNVPDYYPTLYPGIFGPASAIGGTGPASSNGGNQLVFEVPFPGMPPVLPAFRGLTAFPYVFPGAYSYPQYLTTTPISAPYGWIHSPDPQVNVGGPSAAVGVTVEGNANGTSLDYLKNLNHNPLDTGDNLALPASAAGYEQTWWCFPTWRETLSSAWTDPTTQVNVAQAQPFGLNPRDPTMIPVTNSVPAAPIPLMPPSGDQLLPAMTGTWRSTPQLFNDGSGGNTGFFSAAGSLWSANSWEDDLIMTGVRSFDIKAYDNSLASYVDLGWGDDLRLYQPYSAMSGFTLSASWPKSTPPGLASTPSSTLWPPIDPTVNPTAGGLLYDTLGQTFAHEGRMPPLTVDFRYDAQFGQVLMGYYGTTYPKYDGNVGDDNTTVTRLRRVWDSWSTDYSRAPGTGVLANGFPAGPPFTPPVYPSYPPPYPAPLRGIQIQIRVTDPTNQRIKVLTIRQDFTDKL